MQMLLTARLPGGVVLGSERGHRHKVSDGPASSGAAGYSGYMPMTSCSRCHWMQHKGPVRAQGDWQQAYLNPRRQCPSDFAAIHACEAAEHAHDTHAAAG